MEALKALDTQHGKVKVNQVFIICGRPVAKLEVAHIQLRCREKGCCENKQCSMKTGSTCHVLEEYWEGSESEYTAAYMTSRPHEVTCSFPKQKLCPSFPHTRTRTHIQKSKVQNVRQIVPCKAFRLYEVHEMPSWSCFCWLSKTMFQFIKREQACA